MKRLNLMVLALALTVLGGWTWMDDAGEYTCSSSLDESDPDAPDHVWESIWDGGWIPPVVEPDRLGMGFDFMFYGEDFSDTGISYTGELMLGSLRRGARFPVPFTAEPNGFIAVFNAPFSWTQSISAETQGEPGRRQFVVEWQQFVIGGGDTGSDAAFQVALEEGTNAIFFRYEHVDSSLLIAGVGIENQDGTDGINLWHGPVSDFPFDGATIVCVPTYDGDDDGYTLYDGDCDDSDPTANPGERDLCDGIDNDCDGEVDEGFDRDGDGFTSCGGDCDDREESVYPGSTELCDGIDNDCDSGTADGSGEDWLGALCDGADSDECEDGALVCDGEMICQDDPAATVEVCDGFDNDCDGAVDESGGASWWRDSDGDGAGDPRYIEVACEAPDGYVAPGDVDCAGSDSSSYPGAEEVCDGRDNDCDGDIDEGDVCAATDGDADSDSDGDVDGDGDVDSDSDGDADSDVETVPDGELDSEIDGIDDADLPDGDAEVFDQEDGADGDADSDSDGDADGDAPSDGDTGGDQVMSQGCSFSGRVRGVSVLSILFR